MTEVSDSSTRHGLRETATLVVILAFLMNLLSRGFGETFAVFLLPIESEMGWTRTTLAGIYAIYMGAHGLAGVVIGWFVDRVGPRIVYTIGLLIYGLAFSLARFGTEPWHFYLTTGVMAGIAMTAIGMTTATVLITRWYQGPRARQLSPAIGIAYSGMGAGVILWIPITNELIEMLGWRETYRTLGIILCVLAVIVYVLPWRKLQLTTFPFSRFGGVLGDSTDGHLRAALQTKMFWLLCVIMFITAVAMYLVGPQLVAYLVSVGFGSTVASMAFSINGFLTVFGIAGTGWLARHFGCDEHHSLHTPGVPECHPGDGIAGSGNLTVGPESRCTGSNRICAGLPSLLGPRARCNLRRHDHGYWSGWYERRLAFRCVLRHDRRLFPELLCFRC